MQTHTVRTTQVDQNLQNVLQRRWRPNHRVTDAFLKEVFQQHWYQNHMIIDTFLTLLILSADP